LGGFTQARTTGKVLVLGVEKVILGEKESGCSDEPSGEGAAGCGGSKEYHEEMGAGLLSSSVSAGEEKGQNRMTLVVPYSSGPRSSKLTLQQREKDTVSKIRQIIRPDS